MRQIGEALRALQEAERIAPEETRVHYVDRAVTRDLLQLSGLHPRPELRDPAERFGMLPYRHARAARHRSNRRRRSLTVPPDRSSERI